MFHIKYTRTGRSICPIFDSFIENSGERYQRVIQIVRSNQNLQRHDFKKNKTNRKIIVLTTKQRKINTLQHKPNQNRWWSQALRKCKYISYPSKSSHFHRKCKYISYPSKFSHFQWFRIRHVRHYYIFIFFIIHDSFSGTNAL